jgi:hypothetical protein
MAFEHTRVCADCERACPSWADRCPSCGGLSMVYRIVIAPPSASVASIDKASQRKARRVPLTGTEPPHSSPARSTA